jgi:hypothetical protein
MQDKLSGKLVPEAGDTHCGPETSPMRREMAGVTVEVQFGGFWFGCHVISAMGDVPNMFYHFLETDMCSCLTRKSTLAMHQTKQASSLEKISLSCTLE